MPTDEFGSVLDAIRANVREAMKLKGIGAKPLAKQNKMGETVVRDLVEAHNKDVQLGTLAKIAKGTGVPLVDLLRVGPERRTDRPPLSFPTEAELEQAIRDMLPGMPARGLDKRARYLAESVARALRLPPTVPAIDRDLPTPPGEDALPRGATT